MCNIETLDEKMGILILVLLEMVCNCVKDAVLILKIKFFNPCSNGNRYVATILGNISFVCLNPCSIGTHEHFVSNSQIMVTVKPPFHSSKSCRYLFSNSKEVRKNHVRPEFSYVACTKHLIP